jgi:hypothetical protein
MIRSNGMRAIRTSVAFLTAVSGMYIKVHP